MPYSYRNQFSIGILLGIGIELGIGIDAHPAAVIATNIAAAMMNNISRFKFKITSLDTDNVSLNHRLGEAFPGAL